MNFPVIAATAVILPVAAVAWYHPQLLGRLQPKSEPQEAFPLRGVKIVWALGLTYALGFLMAMQFSGFFIHQQGIFAILFSEPGFREAGSEAYTMYNSFMDAYGQKHRTFGHGVIHAMIFALAMLLPIFWIKGLFEGIPFRKWWLDVAFWAVVSALMGD